MGDEDLTLNPRNQRKSHVIRYNRYGHLVLATPITGEGAETVGACWYFVYLDAALIELCLKRRKLFQHMANLDADAWQAEFSWYAPDELAPVIGFGNWDDNHLPRVKLDYDVYLLTGNERVSVTSEVPEANELDPHAHSTQIGNWGINWTSRNPYHSCQVESYVIKWETMEQLQAAKTRPPRPQAAEPKIPEESVRVIASSERGEIHSLRDPAF